MENMSLYLRGIISAVHPTSWAITRLLRRIALFYAREIAHDLRNPFSNLAGMRLIRAVI